jgi:hypothetical protein
MKIIPETRRARSLVSSVVVWRYLFVFFLAIVLSVLLQFMDSVYPFGIFKLFLDIDIDWVELWTYFHLL